jgi:hypothetical protein
MAVRVNHRTRETVRTAFFQLFAQLSFSKYHETVAWHSIRPETIGRIRRSCNDNYAKRVLLHLDKGRDLQSFPGTHYP